MTINHKTISILLISLQIFVHADDEVIQFLQDPNNGTIDSLCFHRPPDRPYVHQAHEQQPDAGGNPTTIQRCLTHVLPHAEGWTPLIVANNAEIENAPHFRGYVTQALEHYAQKFNWTGECWRSMTTLLCAATMAQVEHRNGTKGRRRTVVRKIDRKLCRRTQHLCNFVLPAWPSILPHCDDLDTHVYNDDEVECTGLGRPLTIEVPHLPESQRCPFPLIFDASLSTNTSLIDWTDCRLPCTTPFVSVVHQQSMQWALTVGAVVVLVLILVAVFSSCSQHFVDSDDERMASTSHSFSPLHVVVLGAVPVSVAYCLHLGTTRDDGSELCDASPSNMTLCALQAILLLFGCSMQTCGVVYYSISLLFTTQHSAPTKHRKSKSQHSLISTDTKMTEMEPLSDGNSTRTNGNMPSVPPPPTTYHQTSNDRVMLVESGGIRGQGRPSPRRGISVALMHRIKWTFVAIPPLICVLAIGVAPISSDGFATICVVPPANLQFPLACTFAAVLSLLLTIHLVYEFASKSSTVTRRPHISNRAFLALLTVLLACIVGCALHIMPFMSRGEMLAEIVNDVFQCRLNITFVKEESPSSPHCPWPLWTMDLHTAVYIAVPFAAPLTIVLLLADYIWQGIRVAFNRIPVIRNGRRRADEAEFERLGFTYGMYKETGADIGDDLPDSHQIMYIVGHMSHGLNNVTAMFCSSSSSSFDTSASTSKSPSKRDAYRRGVIDRSNGVPLAAHKVNAFNFGTADGVQEMRDVFNRKGNELGYRNGTDDVKYFDGFPPLVRYYQHGLDGDRFEYQPSIGQDDLLQLLPDNEQYARQWHTAGVNRNHKINMTHPPLYIEHIKGHLAGVKRAEGESNAAKAAAVIVEHVVHVAEEVGRHEVSLEFSDTESDIDSDYSNESEKRRFDEQLRLANANR